MTLWRQSRFFVAVGIAQWAVDCGVMVTLAHAGIAVAGANLAGRVSGALLGFWLNGRFTFGDAASRPGWRQFTRYLVLWCAMAGASTAAVTALDAMLGRHAALLGKPPVDGVLALVSFLASRGWVFR